MADIVERLRHEVAVGSGTVTPLRQEAAAEIERMQEVLRSIASRAQDAKRLCEESAPVSAYNLAAGILGEISSDAPELTAKTT